MKLYDGEEHSPNAPGGVLLPILSTRQPEWPSAKTQLLTSQSSRRRWRIALCAILLGLASLLGIYWQTAATAVHIWLTSSAYNYAVLIAPISAYLVWEKRAVVAAMTPMPSFWGVAATAFFSLGWFLAYSLHIHEGMHLALVGMMQGLFLAVIGPRIFGRLAFPLLYLFLMVPTGEFLLEPLRHLSHAGSVLLIGLSGIPVYAEGLSIQVPHGNFFVEPGCAGLNFLLSSIALSLLYGKLVYRRISSRVICVVAAVAIAIVANIVRIFLIIALTEWSRRQLAIADDHLAFGWGFFSVVMVAALWVGGKFIERDVPHAITDELVLIPEAPPSPHRIAAFTLVAILVATAPGLDSAFGGLVARHMRDIYPLIAGSY